MALHIVHKFSFSRNDIKKTDFSNSQFMMITPLSTQTTSMAILIVDYSVSRDTIGKNRLATLYVASSSTSQVDNVDGSELL